MAVLSDTDRQRIVVGLGRYLSNRSGEYPLTGDFDKDDLRAAVNATDSWIDQNQAAFIAALPDPFKSATGADEKVLLFVSVTAMRKGVGFVRSLIGEVD